MNSTTVTKAVRSARPARPVECALVREVADDLETGTLAGDSTLTVRLDDRRTNLLFQK